MIREPGQEFVDRATSGGGLTEPKALFFSQRNFPVAMALGQGALKFTASEMVVLMFLSSTTKGWKVSGKASDTDHTLNWFAIRVGLPKRTLQWALKRLEKEGYLTVTHQGPHTVSYAISDKLVDKCRTIVALMPWFSRLTKEYGEWPDKEWLAAAYAETGLRGAELIARAKAMREAAHPNVVDINKRQRA